MEYPTNRGNRRIMRVCTHNGLRENLLRAGRLKKRDDFQNSTANLRLDRRRFDYASFGYPFVREAATTLVFDSVRDYRRGQLSVFFLF